jgi:O-antigen/teichoic acid export membrane protein
MVSIWVTTLGLRIATMLVSLVNVVIVARILGPTESGQYFLFIAVVLVLAVVAELGLSQSAMVFPSMYPDALAQIHATLLKCVIVLSGAALIVGLALYVFVGDVALPSFPAAWMGVVCVAVPLMVYANVWNFLTIGLGRVVAAGLVQLGAIVATLLLNVIALGLVHGHAFAAVLVYTIVLVLQTSVMFAYAHRLGRQTGPAVIPGRLAREMVTFGIRGYAGAMSSFLWMRATVFLLEAFHGPTAVGIFSIAQQLAERLLLPAQVVKDVVYREIASLDRESATRATNRYLRIAIAGLVPIVLVVAVIAPWLVRTLFGIRYAASAGVFRILFIGSVVMIVPTLLVPYFLGQLRRPGLLSALAWLNVVVNTGLALWLVPQHAERGAAFALVGTQLVGTGIVLAIYLRSARTTVQRAVFVKRDDIEAMRRRLDWLVRGRGFD